MLYSPPEGVGRIAAARRDYLEETDHSSDTQSFTSEAVIARRPHRRRPAERTPRPEKPEPEKESPIEVFGTVKQVFPSTTFAVELENGLTILAHIAGRLRRHRIRILPGDRVDLEMSPYDLSKGRIIYRYRSGEMKH